MRVTRDLCARLGETAQSITCLLSKPEDESNPRTDMVKKSALGTGERHQR